MDGKNLYTIKIYGLLEGSFHATRKQMEKFMDMIFESKYSAVCEKVDLDED